MRGPEHPGPWKTIEELGLPTLGGVHWHNNERLRGFIEDLPPAEFEETFYAENRQARTLPENTIPSLYEIQDGSNRLGERVWSEARSERFAGRTPEYCARALQCGAQRQFASEGREKRKTGLVGLLWVQIRKKRADFRL